MKKKVAICTAVLAVLSVLLSSCFNESKADKSLPDFATAGYGIENANEAGWYEVFTDEFTGDTLNGDIWTTSPHGLRTASNMSGDTAGMNSSYWCPDMVSVHDGIVEIRAEQRTDHVCSSGICPSSGIFTGGIETREVLKDGDGKGTGDRLLFGQAFGYFETKVKFPNGEGVWSAFWLQSSNQRKLGNAGRDGTEIDIYESAFVLNPTVMGHALLWNGYGKEGRVKDKKINVGYDLFDGWHTFALKWTPKYYVFYIDGVATWATNGGGVAKVKEFLRLTVEVDQGDKSGPHGQTIGNFNAANEYVFSVDYVKVYQNKNYAKYEKEDSYYKGKLSKAN
ncbi:MAG: glycoside hydrolase family 16 protein [Clostridiales bacterium]|jgi:hypothetical protein|nr:glycoside hydrolase family 16 protein [Clostridiales bacterium]